MEICFEELEQGDVFKYRNIIFLRIADIINRESTDSANAIELESGFFHWFNGSELIHKIDCQLIVE